MDTFFHLAKLEACGAEVHCMIAAFGLLWDIGEMARFSFLLYMLLMGFIPEKWSDIYSPASQIYLKQ